MTTTLTSDACEGGITLTEVLSVIRSFANNKASDYDGLSAEFFQDVFGLIGRGN